MERSDIVFWRREAQAMPVSYVGRATPRASANRKRTSREASHAMSHAMSREALLQHNHLRARAAITNDMHEVHSAGIRV